jgi:hypothetical protein
VIARLELPWRVGRDVISRPSSAGARWVSTWVTPNKSSQFRIGRRGTYHEKKFYVNLNFRVCAADSRKSQAARPKRRLILRNAPATQEQAPRNGQPNVR